MKYLEIKEYYGLETKDSKASLPIGFSPEGYNMDLSLRGVAKTRGGSLKFTPVQLGYNVERIHDYYKPSIATHTFVGNGGTEVFTLDGLGAATTIGTGFTNGEIFDFLNFQDEVYMSNGVDRPAKFDGTTFSNWGIDAPGTAPTFAPDGAGVLNGNYQYCYTYVNSLTGHESSRSDLSAVRVAAAATINLTGITVSPDPQVSARRIYRTTSGGAFFFFLFEIPDNTTTIYADNNPDSSLGTSEAPEENNPPQEFVFLEEWDGRIWGVLKNSTFLWFSNDEFQTLPGNGIPHESFSPDNFVNFFLQIYGIKKSPYFNELWVHTSAGIRGIRPTGIAEDPYEPFFKNGSWNAISHYSIQNIFNDQWFLSEEGKVISIDHIGNVHYESEAIEPELTGMNLALAKKVQSAHYRKGTKNQYRILYPRSGQTDYDRMANFNYLNRTPQQKSTVEVHRISASRSIGVVKNSSGEGILYTGDTNKDVQIQDLGTNDNGVAIEWSHSIGWLRSAGSPVPTAFPRWIKMYFNPIGSYKISLRTDFDFGQSGGQVYPVDMTGIGDLLDVSFILDSSILSADNLLKSETIDVGGDYQYALITLFGNALDQVMEMHNSMLLFEEIEGFRR